MRIALVARVRRRRRSAPQARRRPERLDLSVHALRMGAVGERRRRRARPQLLRQRDADRGARRAELRVDELPAGQERAAHALLRRHLRERCLGRLVRNLENLLTARRGTIGGALSADYKYWIIEAGGTYEIASWNSHGGRYATPDTQLELLAGGRYWHQELDIAVALAGTANVDGLIVSGDRALARSGGVEWVDPFVGARDPLPAGARRGGRGARRHRRLWSGKQVHLAGARHLQLAGLHAWAHADRRLRRLARAAGRLCARERASSATSSTCSSRARSGIRGTSRRSKHQSTGYRCARHHREPPLHRPECLERRRTSVAAAEDRAVALHRCCAWRPRT